MAASITEYRRPILERHSAQDLEMEGVSDASFLRQVLIILQDEGMVVSSNNRHIRSSTSPWESC